MPPNRASGKRSCTLLVSITVPRLSEVELKQLQFGTRYRGESSPGIAQGSLGPGESNWASLRRSCGCSTLAFRLDPLGEGHHLLPLDIQQDQILHFAPADIEGHPVQPAFLAQ
jgi:hypothetical protein